MISKFLQIVSLRPRISKVFLITWTILEIKYHFCQVGADGAKSTLVFHCFVFNTLFQIIPRNSVDYYYYRAAQNYGHKSTYDSRFPNIFLRGTFKTDKRKLIKSLAQTEKSRKMSFKVCTKKGLESYQLIESDFLSKYGTLFTGLHPVA